MLIHVIELVELPFSLNFFGGFAVPTVPTSGKIQKRKGSKQNTQI